MSTHDHRDFDVEIVSSEGVLGGKPRLQGHRISVLDVTELLRMGYSVSEVGEQLSITPDEVRAAAQYYRMHKDDMAEYERQRRKKYDEHGELPEELST